MRLLVLAVALAVLGGPAAAQISITSAAPATVEEIAAARAEADRLITQAGAQDLFENITGDARPTVLHRASGLVCRFQAGAAGNAIALYPAQTAVGDDVGCNIPTDGVSITHYATRYAEATSAEREAHLAVASIRERVGQVRPHEGETVSGGSPDLPVTYMARLEVTVDGRDLYTHVATAEVQGWIFKQLLTAALDQALDAQTIGSALWIGTLLFAQERLSDLGS